MTTAVVVGSGPNGLTGAALLARAGVRVTVIEAAPTIGGGTRTSDLFGEGTQHDHCAAAHPLGAASPVFAELGLERHGLRWRSAEIDLAHPLPGGRGTHLLADLDATAEVLGDSGSRWRRVFGGLADRFDVLGDEVLGPLVHRPRHPLTLARFGAAALLPATVLARALGGPEAQALFLGIAAHAIADLRGPATASVGLMLGAAAHHVGWPVAEGGSRAVTDALAAVIAEHGGRFETGRPVTRLEEVEPADIVLLDVSPAAMLDLCGDRIPAAMRAAAGRWTFGPGAHKVDLVVEDGIPWSYEPARRAGTVHVGGTAAQIVATEAQVTRGRLPESPFMLVGQQYLADPGRSRGNRHPVWIYAHVPAGFTADVTDRLLDRLEIEAPGLRERIVAVSHRTAAGFETYNANFVGGDIATGAFSLRQTLARPRVGPHPYDTGVPGVYLCSAATPPGAGVHGMCGAHAARRALARLQ